MLKMRLQRVGRKNDPSYRIVVVDSRTGPKSNKHIDLLGSYNPKHDHIQLDADRAKEWLGKGVQPSDTLFNILVTEGVVDGPKRNVLPKKQPIASEEDETATEETATATAEEEATEEETPVEEPAETASEEAPADDSAPAEEAETEEAPREEEAPAEESDDESEPESESDETPEEEQKKDA